MARTKRKIEDVLPEITQDLLHKIFSYNKETGEFKRVGRLTSSGKILPCDFVGTATSSHGYFQYTVKDFTFDAHRLIWKWATGEWPVLDIDHINGDRRDNRWKNLRQVTREQNLRNVGRKSNPKHGHVGVYEHGEKWRISIGEEHKAGFATLEEAVAYRKKREKELGYSELHFNREVWGDGHS